MKRIVDSPFGKALQAMRDNPLRVESIGINEDDVVIVSFGEDLAASTLITLHLKEMKVKTIIVKAPNEDHKHVLEKVAELGVPLTCHTGQLGAAPLRGKYGDPIHLDDVTQEFPNLTITAGHMAFGWHEQLFYLAGLKYNIMTDVSAWQDVAKFNFRKFCTVLRQALDRLGKDRVLFGTDNPFVSALMSTKEYADLIKGLPQNAPEGIAFTEDEVNAILGGNAARGLFLYRNHRWDHRDGTAYAHPASAWDRCWPRSRRGHCR
jgi:hypothetical protein